jgi:hypothetical protein
MWSTIYLPIDKNCKSHTTIFGEMASAWGCVLLQALIANTLVKLRKLENICASSIERFSKIAPDSGAQDACEETYWIE